MFYRVLYGIRRSDVSKNDRQWQILNVFKRKRQNENNRKPASRNRLKALQCADYAQILTPFIYAPSHL